MDKTIDASQIGVAFEQEINPSQPVRITLGENMTYRLSGKEADELFIAATVAHARASAMGFLGEIDVSFTIQSDKYVVPKATAEKFLKELGAVYGKWKK
jgi:hypothetical protein